MSPTLLLLGPVSSHLRMYLWGGLSGHLRCNRTTAAVAVGKWESRALGGIPKRRGNPVFGFPRSAFSTAVRSPRLLRCLRPDRLPAPAPVRPLVNAIQLPLDHLSPMKPIHGPLQMPQLRHALRIGLRATRHPLQRSLRPVVDASQFH